MCGICGYIDISGDIGEEVLESMISTLHHRGPDDRGLEIYRSSDICVGLGHTRLSIIDLSEDGHQPMSYNGLSIVFNGEIYNYQEIKTELQVLGHKFISFTDTEVVLHSYAEWGDLCVTRFIGMFAFVIFDVESMLLKAFRDRAGVKPLYYYVNKDVFIFGSELKVFHKHPGFEKEINVLAVHQFTALGYVPSDLCIFNNTYKLGAGHFFEYDIRKRNLKLKKYWDVADSYRLSKLDISYEEAKSHLKTLLSSAFEYRLVSDVPVGVFLSGGYDSTAVSAILQKDSNRKLRTFTIGFQEGNNEAPHARKIAQYLDTEHSEYYCTYKEAQEIIPNLPFFYDEPFADSSAIPTMLISKLASKDVTVVLSADGGDEIFAGYNKYNRYLNRLNDIQSVPNFLKSTLSITVKFLSNHFALDKEIHSKLEILQQILSSKDDRDKFALLTNYPLAAFHTEHKDLFFSRDFHSRLLQLPPTFLVDNALSTALINDYKNYLQDDILVKVDRATMSSSIESREPFLDHRIVEFCAQLPNEFKYQNGRQKIILKDIVHDYVPKQLMDRPKTGFSVPIFDWLQKDLIFLLEENLSKKSIDSSGFFNYDYLCQVRKEFLKGNSKHASLIWNVIQFQLWYKKWM